MATYCITFAEDDDWGESKNRYKTKTEAEKRLAEVRATGRFARLIVWANNQPTELERVNAVKDKS